MNLVLKYIFNSLNLEPLRVEKETGRFWLRMVSIIALWFTFAAGTASGSDILHHSLEVRLDPASNVVQVTDRIQLPAAMGRTIRFILRKPVSIVAEGATLRTLDNRATNQFREYVLTVDRLPAEVILTYRLQVTDAKKRADHGMPGAWLNTDGVFLDSGSGWYPRFGPALFSFKMEVTAPDDWQIVSQDQGRYEHGRFIWQSAKPQQEIYLLGGPYRRYAAPHGRVELAVYLLGDDQQLADRYLRVMGQYLDFYSALIGEYPYAQFAVIENRWQTGYGMPSFTLLGSRVLRLPFILHSSLPHEILHNWWGNGVYVDVSSGNWSEGLTAYLADHLIKESQGQGADYRRKALERYANYAAEGRDIPLRQFRARHSDATQAVGYGKTLMLFHMLRREVGDGAFVAGLKTFWERYRFTEAGFEQFSNLIQQTAGRTVDALDTAWLNRAGAPAIAIERADVTKAADGGFQLDLTIAQSQAGDAYVFDLPLAVNLDGSNELRRFEIDVKERVTTWSQRFESRPVRLDVDPNYDVFRLLDAKERPSSLSRLFGAKKQVLVVPSDAIPQVRQAWQALAAAWVRRFGNVEAVTDKGLKQLPEDAAVWLLGWNNRWLDDVRLRFKGAGQQLTAQGFSINDSVFDAGEVVVALDPDNRRPALGFVGARTEREIVALARKLPHYGSFGRLVFEADSVNNIRREGLPVVYSPLSRVFSADDPGPPKDITAPLAELVGVRLRFD